MNAAAVEVPERDPGDGAYHFEPFLTVGQLRALLADVDDSTQITLATDAWYVNVEGVVIPEDGGFSTVTLFGGTEFDTRQV